MLMLVLLVAVGQMAQTIYIPAIADMAKELNVREGAVQSVMAAYLLTYGAFRSCSMDRCLTASGVAR